MTEITSLLLLLSLLTNFVILGTSRLGTCIRAIAAQGVFLSLLPVMVAPATALHTLPLAVGTFVVKALALPWLLRWAIREASVRREVEPLLGYVSSLLAGAVSVALAFAIAARLPLPPGHNEALVPAALVNVMTGLIVLTARRKAVTQVIGYLMLENGVYLFGQTLVDRLPLLVELGVLLDVFAGVFVMGIVVFHISREFDLRPTVEGDAP